jgi:DNA polymerase-4
VPPTPHSPLRRILLVDADAFFVAVARQVDPEGAGRAELLIVGGSAESRGVVCSASYAARRFGVRSGMPIRQAVRRCPAALCVPVPRAACARRSREIAAVLARWAPVVQASSIDEWYLDLGGTEALYGEPLAATARRIRAAVHAATGLGVSIGGGTSKLVAKLAVELGKPGAGGDGVHVVAPGEEGTFLRRFTLGELPMVGPKLTERLARLGLRTVDDALAHGEAGLVGCSARAPAPGCGRARAAWTPRRCGRASRRRASAARTRSRTTCTTTRRSSASCCGSSAAWAPTCAATGCARARSR